MFRSWMWKQRSFREQHQGDEATGGAGGTAATETQDGEGDEQAAEQQDDQQDEAAATSTQGEADDGEVVITIGDEAPPAASEDEIEGKPAPQWVKDLRKQARELAKENRELKQAQQTAQAAPKVDPVGEKPTLEGCDFDDEAYAEKLLAWTERKRQAEAQAATQRQEQEAAQATWTAKLNTYQTQKAALKVGDFDDAEAVVLETLSPAQQSIIISGADNPSHVVYALGKNPAKAKELATIKDPVKYAFAIAKLETQLKVTPRKAPPPAERQVRGSAGGATSMDNQLVRLQAEADRTGDRSKVIAYKREQRSKAAA